MLLTLLILREVGLRFVLPALATVVVLRIIPAAVRKKKICGIKVQAYATASRRPIINA